MPIYFSARSSLKSIGGFLWGRRSPSLDSYVVGFSKFSRGTRGSVPRGNLSTECRFGSESDSYVFSEPLPIGSSLELHRRVTSRGAANHAHGRITGKWELMASCGRRHRQKQLQTFRSGRRSLSRLLVCDRQTGNCANTTSATSARSGRRSWFPARPGCRRRAPARARGRRRRSARRGPRRRPAR